MLFLLFQSRFVLNLKDPWTHGSLIMNLKNRTRQRRHFLKSKYFDRVTDKAMVVQTPPMEVEHMSAADWCKLVDNWSTPEKQVVSLFTQPCHFFNSTNWNVANLFILFVSVDVLYESHN